MIFPENERLLYEKEKLYPIANIDPKEAEKYRQVVLILKKLSYAENEMARSYLEGRLTKNEAITY